MIPGMRIAVIGGGIVGTLCSMELSGKHDVTLFDGGAERKAASWGNAGFISPAFGPLSPTKASFSKMLHWMEPSSVVKVRAGFFLKKMGWLLDYMRKSSAISGKNEMSLVREMAIYGKDWYSTFSENHDINMRKDGLLEPYFDDKGLKQRVLEINSYDSGIRYDVLGKSDVAIKEPSLNVCAGGIFYPEECVLEPAKLLSEARSEAEKVGVDFIRSDVRKFRISGGKVDSIESDETREFDLYIASMGAFNALPFGIPVAAGRGYTITTKPVDERLSSHALIGDFRLAVSQTSEGRIRAGGFFELTDPLAKPDERIYGSIERFLKQSYAIDFETEDKWFGSRPCTPDLLPLSGKTRVKNLLLASGHCRLGVTLAPFTAKVISEIVDGKDGRKELDPRRLGV